MSRQDSGWDFDGLDIVISVDTAVVGAGNGPVFVVVVVVAVVVVVVHVVHVVKMTSSSTCIVDISIVIIIAVIVIVDHDDFPGNAVLVELSPIGLTAMIERWRRQGGRDVGV